MTAFTLKCNQREMTNKLTTEQVKSIYEKNWERVGDIGNYYGCLSVAKIEDLYYWAIENHDGFNPEEITKDLYDALIAFNTKEK